MTANNVKNFGRKLSKAAELLAELGAQLDSLDDFASASGSTNGAQNARRGGESTNGPHDARGGGGRSARGFEGGVDHASTRVVSAGAQTEIDEPEIGWRMGFIRMLDGRCPWCGERIELVTCGPHAGITWQCPEACNP